MYNECIQSTGWLADSVPSEALQLLLSVGLVGRALAVETWNPTIDSGREKVCALRLRKDPYQSQELQ